MNSNHLRSNHEELWEPVAGPVLRAERTRVAQTGSLLYRGLATRRPSTFEKVADCQSAIQQINNLRYMKNAY